MCLEFFILKFTEPLQSCCCPVQKNLPRWAELAWQVSRYLWRGSVDFKKNLDHLSSSFSKLKNGDFKTRDFSPLIERVLAGVICLHGGQFSTLPFSPASYAPAFMFAGEYFCPILFDECVIHLFDKFFLTWEKVVFFCFWNFCRYILGKNRVHCLEILFFLLCSNHLVSLCS